MVAADNVRKSGKVYLVGAGPGRADLITVRGAEVLESADCVICDKLANPALLGYVPAGAEIIHTPKRIGGDSFTQQQINELLIEKTRAGKTVVRLKGGDPCIFGRGGEEALLLAQAGIDFEIVPGITAAVAAAEYAGIMLTDRRYSSQVVFVTGHEADDKQQSGIDWPWLAKFSGTIVFYMGMGNLDFITARLMENGLSSDTPAAVIENATLPVQKLVRATVGSIAAVCTQQGVGAPAIIVIGAAAQSDAGLNWFMAQPLFGKNIIITRDARGNAEFAAKIIEKGGNPIDFPTIALRPLTQSKQFLQALAKLGSFDWIIFTSGNGVSMFFEALAGLGKDTRVFASTCVAAIGPASAEKLRQFGIIPDFVPASFTSADLGKELVAFTSVKNKKVLMLRSDLASEDLARVLSAAGAVVEQVSLYTVVPLKTEGLHLMERLKSDAVDWLTFASPAAVRSFFEQIPNELVNSARARVASIGPVTSEELRNLKIKIDVEAAEHTIDGLLAAIEGLSR